MVTNTRERWSLTLSARVIMLMCVSWNASTKVLAASFVPGEVTGNKVYQVLHILFLKITHVISSIYVIQTNYIVTDSLIPTLFITVWLVKSHGWYLILNGWFRITVRNDMNYCEIFPITFLCTYILLHYHSK